MTFIDTNVTELLVEEIETLDDLNKRYANALMPMAVWMGLLATMGIFGNVLVILVFSISPEYKNTNFKVFVISLAAIDLLTCVTLMPAEILKTRHYFFFADGTPCKVKCFFNLFGQNASAFILLVICVDRFRKVCMPLKHQIWPGLASKLVIGIMVVSFIFSIPAPILCGISSANKTNIHGTNTTVFFCAAEDIYRDNVFRKIYKVGLTIALFVVGIAFVVMYSLILRTIIRHWGNTGNGKSVRFENKGTFGKSNRNDMERSPYGSELKVMDGLKIAKTSHCGFPECEASIVPILNGNHDGRKSRSPSSNSHASGKAMFNLRKNGSLRSSSDYSLKAYSIRRKYSSITNGRIPYKTLIWIILTFVFVVTYLINALLAFITMDLFELSPQGLLLFTFFFRLYFINNVINPIIYICLDKRFKVSCCHIVNLIKRRWRLCCAWN